MRMVYVVIAAGGKERALPATAMHFIDDERHDTIRLVLDLKRDDESKQLVKALFLPDNDRHT
jgi:hypothetical protein